MPAPPELLTPLLTLIGRLQGPLQTAGDRISAAAGQTHSRHQVLACLDVGPLTVAEVARRLGYQRQSVQRTADLLVTDDLARYEPNPAHRRAQLLRLTPQGQRVLSTLEQEYVDWASRLAYSLDPDRLREATHLLTQLEDLLTRGRSGR